MTFLWTETLTPAAYQPRLRHALGHACLLAQMPTPHQGVKISVTPDMPTNHNHATIQKLRVYLIVVEKQRTWRKNFPSSGMTSKNM